MFPYYSRTRVVFSMEEQKKKKRWRRRSYLSDFKKDATGQYAYAGNVYKFDGDENERRKFTLTLGALCVMSIVTASAQEFLPGTQMSNMFYVLIPWLLQFLGSVSVVWAYARLAWGGAKLREYVYNASVKKLPTRSLLTAVLSFATAASEIIYICINGLGERAAPTALRPVLSLINGSLCLSIHLYMKGKTRYRI